MNIESFIKSNNWKFSKSYAESAPHEYIVRNEVSDQNSFVEFVQLIRDTGFSARFWTLNNIYLEVDGYYYWTMGAPIDETVIINRCKVQDYEVTEHKNFGKIMRWKNGK